MPRVFQRRGTLAALDALSAANQLSAGEIYLITDEERLAVAIANNQYVKHAKFSEISGGGGFLTAQVSFNFAAQRSLSKVFAVPGATTAMRVLASAHADSDEHEMDPLACSACVVSANNVRVVCSNTSGTGLSGARLVNLILN